MRRSLAAVLAVVLLGAAGCGVLEDAVRRAIGSVSGLVGDGDVGDRPEAADAGFSVAADENAADALAPQADEADEVAGGSGFFKVVEPNGTVRFVSNLSQVPVNQRDDAERLALEPRTRNREARAAPVRRAERQLAAAEPPSPAARTHSSADVVLYTTSWCGTCKRTLAWLDEKGIDYVNKDVEEDRDAAAEMQEVAGGRNAVPVVVIDGEVMIGFNPGRMEKLLGL